MAWIEVHQALPTHRKTLALADELNIEPVHAVGHLTCLWLWALDNAPDGSLADVSARTLARAAQWRKDPEAFAAALMVAGLMDQDKSIHDWTDYAGRLIERRKKDADRKRSERSADPDIPPPSNGHPSDIPPPSDASRARVNRTVPNRTQPNPTGPNTNEVPPGVPPTKNGQIHALEKPPSKSAAVIDAFSNHNISLVLSARDHAAIKHSNAPPELIVEVYDAVARCEYGDDFMRRRLSVHEAIEWINGYVEAKENKAWRANGESA